MIFVREKSSVRGKIALCKGKNVKGINVRLLPFCLLAFLLIVHLSLFMHVCLLPKQYFYLDMFTPSYAITFSHTRVMHSQIHKHPNTD